MERKQPDRSSQAYQDVIEFQGLTEVPARQARNYHILSGEDSDIKPANEQIAKPTPIIPEN